MSLQGSELSLQMASVGSSITHALNEGLAKVVESIKQEFASLEKEWKRPDQCQASCQSALGKDLTEKKMTAILPQRKSVALFDSLCSCSTNRPQQHESGCFHSFQHKKVYTVARRFRIFSLLLHFRLEVQRAPFAFARDLKVYPNFSMRCMVDIWKSEAFTLVNDAILAMGSRPSAPELAKRFRDCLFGLRKLFEEGKAWPTDVTTDGYSLLHVSVSGPL